MEHKETQSQSRNNVRDSEKDFGSRFAADLVCSLKMLVATELV